MDYANDDWLIIEEIRSYTYKEIELKKELKKVQTKLQELKKDLVKEWEERK